MTGARESAGRDAGSGADVGRILTPSADTDLEQAPAPDVSHVKDARVPDFFIIGHPKSGTTALYEMLRRHPQIYMSDVKEPRFFSSDLPSAFKPTTEGVLPATYADYLSMFDAAAPGQRVGEASTSYVWSRTAAANIAAVRPDARIIAVLREPAGYMRSLHLQLMQIHVETEKSLRKAMALEDARRAGRHLPSVMARSPQVLMYSDRVRYVEQLRRYHSVFPAEQVLVLIYDDFQRDNERTVRKVLRFLEVDDEAPIDATTANPTVRVRSQQLEDVMNAVSLGRGPLTRTLKAGLKTVTPRQLRSATYWAMRRRLLFGRPRAPDERFAAELRRRFKPEVVALSAYLDRDLVTLWGYDRVG